MAENIQIALVGRNALIREGLRHILSEKSFHVISSGDEPAQVVCEDEDCPLIILIDQSSNGYDENEIEALCHSEPNARIVLLAERLDLDQMVEAFRLGVHGYIIKNVCCESLLGSLQLVALGEKVLPGQLAEELSHISHVEAPVISVDAGLGDTLSAREAEILRCLIIGLPNKLIARRLDLSEATVKVHVKGILRKLGARNRTQAAIYALNHGLDGTFKATSESEQPNKVPPPLTSAPGTLAYKVASSA